jgi:hypothetical protein
MWKTILCLIGLVVAFPAFAQEQDLRSQVVNYAVQGATRLRDRLVDPTSFTLLEVKAFSRFDKHGNLKFGGCIRAVAANSLGAKNQKWFNFALNSKKNEIEVGGESDYTESGCAYMYRKDWVSYDITEDVRKNLKPLDGGK